MGGIGKRIGSSKPASATQQVQGSLEYRDMRENIFNIHYIHVQKLEK